jgi:hypothetical protein
MVRSHTLATPHSHRSRRIAIALLASALTLAAAGADAGILRDVMAKVGIGKPAGPPKTDSGEMPTLPRQGFACCNLHHDGDTIVDTNHAEMEAMIKAGTPITVLGYGRNRANIDVEGVRMVLDHDAGQKEESLDTWATKIVVNEDPKPRINAWPANILAAVRAGKVVRGMTRQQALAAVGYPPTNLTKSIDDDVWRLLVSRRGEYQLHFGTDGRVATITGDGEVTSQVIYLPPPRK